MTDFEQLNRERLKKSLERCQLHLDRMHFAMQHLNELFPLKKETYLDLPEMSILLIDQLIFRFTKLQDELGVNSFRFLLISLQEDIEGLPFKDILNKLERLRIIETTDEWMELRELRNNLAHEYPTLVEETIEKLNYFFGAISVLEKIVISVIQNAKKVI